MAKENRIENDVIGQLPINSDSLSGIHTARAIENFGVVGGCVNPRLLRSYGTVKYCCAMANHDLGYLSDEIYPYISQAAKSVEAGDFDVNQAPAALQGGAGTSTNMFINELIANKALLLMGKKIGDYDVVSPLNHINLHQSTNDTYPTALKVAALIALSELEQVVSELTDAFQRKEREFADVVRLARTELCDAVPITLGQNFGAWAEAFSKDRWRIYKCSERLRVINLGGTAIGTGNGADRRYIFAVAEMLRQETNLPLARAENMVQATQNCDEFVEVSGILKALATNLFKISNDLRLLASGPESGLGEIKLPARQAGSSIMPGKINPVITEMVSQVAMQAISHDSAITLAAMNGQLELNAFLPLLSHNLLAMLDELITACEKMRAFMVEDIEADKARCEDNLHNSTAVITAFIGKIGYDKASEVSKKASQSGKTIKQVLLEEGLCSEDDYDMLTSPEAALALGFRRRK
ncbi:MAG: aspartate ammonia-lyase [Sedimentisphaeraceae bacterium JB056]